MRIGLIIDTVSSLYARQRMVQHDHEYIIYRDQLNQHSSQTTASHHHQIMKQGVEYLIGQGVDHIICPPVIELQYQQQYPQILPIFQRYLDHVLRYSIVGKIGFVGSAIQCQDINLQRGDIASKNLPTSRQVSNRHYNHKLPLWTSIDQNLTQRLDHHKPDHFIVNHVIKSLLRPLKDANVDTIIGLDWSYYACDVSLTHHCRSIRRHRSDVLRTIWEEYSFTHSQYSVTIHHTGTLRDIQANKKLRWLLARGKNIQIQQVKID